MMPLARKDWKKPIVILFIRYPYCFLLIILNHLGSSSKILQIDEENLVNFSEMTHIRGDPPQRMLVRREEFTIGMLPILLQIYSYFILKEMSDPIY